MHRISLACVATVLCLAPVTSVLAQATDGAGLSVSADLSEADAGRVPLYLEVTLNGNPTNLVAEFALEPRQRPDVFAEIRAGASRA